MAQTLTLETTVVQRETRRLAEILFLPTATLELIGVKTPIDAAEVLGLPLGPEIGDAEDAMDVAYASLQGRAAPFDPGSYERWRPRRLSQPKSAGSVFARQLVTEDLVPVSSSPIRGVSISTLISHGVAWTGAGADAVLRDPLQGLAIFVLAEIGLAIEAPMKGWREAHTQIAKYRALQRAGVPPNEDLWWFGPPPPPDDR